MNRKLLLGFFMVLIFFGVVNFVYGANVDITDCIDHNVTVSVSDSGSKQLWAVDNLVGAKNKIYTTDEKDLYEIDGYIFDNGDFVQLIYNNGKQNNADKKSCYVNGQLSDMVKIYGKDGDTTIKVNYTVFKHDNITVNFINEIGGRYTSISNNIGKDGSWSNNGKLFDNQISGLEFLETETGNYTFIGWKNDLGEFVNSFSFDWIGNQILNFNYTAVYDFIPVPVDNSTDNSTNDTSINNQTNVTVDNSTNGVHNNESNVPLKQNETVKYQNNKSNIKNNNNPLSDNENSTVSSTSNSTSMPISHITGHSLVGVLILVVLFIGLVYVSRKER